MKNRKIIQSLKNILVQKIKQLGFSGVFPHFRRKNNDRYEFLSFQFNRNGGSFVVEIGFITPSHLDEWEKELSFEKLNYGNTPVENRLRIKPQNAPEDFWFEYSQLNKDEEFDNLAQSVTKLLPQVISFFEK